MSRFALSVLAAVALLFGAGCCSHDNQTKADAAPQYRSASDDSPPESVDPDSDPYSQSVPIRTLPPARLVMPGESYTYTIRFDPQAMDNEHITIVYSSKANLDEPIVESVEVPRGRVSFQLTLHAKAEAVNDEVLFWAFNRDGESGTVGAFCIRDAEFMAKLRERRTDSTIGR